MVLRDFFMFIRRKLLYFVHILSTQVVVYTNHTIALSLKRWLYVMRDLELVWNLMDSKWCKTI
jgi:hypothetical protein